MIRLPCQGGAGPNSGLSFGTIPTGNPEQRRPPTGLCSLSLNSGLDDLLLIRALCSGGQGPELFRFGPLVRIPCLRRPETVIVSREVSQDGFRDAARAGLENRVCHSVGMECHAITMVVENEYEVSTGRAME